MVSTAFLQIVGELKGGECTYLQVYQHIGAYGWIGASKRNFWFSILFGNVHSHALQQAEVSNSLKDVNMTYCEYYICIHLVYMYCIYVYIYIGCNTFAHGKSSSKAWKVT